MRKMMTVLLILLGVSVALAQTAGAPGIGDDFYPDLGNGGYDVQHYLIQVDIDDTLRHITGETGIEAVATQDLSAFNLDFIGMTVDAVLVNDTEASITRDGREMTVTPAEPLATGELFTITVRYHGTPGKDEDGDALVFNNGWIVYPSGIFVASEPDGSAAWFPANDHPLDKAKFRFVVTVASDYVVAANGRLRSRDDSAGRTTWIWDMEYPMATYLATVNVQKFALVTDETSASGVEIRNYFPERLADAGAQAFRRQTEMIDYFETVFGPYPFDVYGAVVADANLGFALETQTLSLFGKNIIEQAVSASGTPSESIIVHELAHQWFGDSVTPATWRDLWLNEGFATYAQILWLEHTAGRAVADRQLVNFYTTLRNPIFVRNGISAPGNPPPEALFNTAVYLRGGWALHALRLHIGDRAFFTLIKTYAETFKYGNVTTSDFIGMAVAISGDPSAADVLNSWLYDEHLPDVPEMQLFGTN